MGNTKKVGTTGRYSARYGVGVKKRVLAVEKRMANEVQCPFCGFSKTKREAAGLFLCRKCNAKFTGGAYEPQTLVGKTINKMVSQKQFLLGAEELIKAKESTFSDIEREVEKALTSSGTEEKEEKPAKKARKVKKKTELEEVPNTEPEEEKGEEEEEN